MRRHYSKNQRTELVDLVTSGRATVSEAAAQLGVTPSTAYYWTKGRVALVRARMARPSRSPKALPLVEPTFVRVLPSSTFDATLAVRIGGAEIQVRRGFDADLLLAVVRALRGGTS